VIIVDLNQVMLSNMLMQLGKHTNAPLDENMFRHMVLNSLRSYKVKFGVDYGEMIIACDNKNYWRKKIFPYYKENRKKNLEESEINWKEIFDYLNKIRGEIKEYLPYRVIDVESAEADDIIATLCEKFSDHNETTLVLSGDKDFIQLHKYKNVQQYDPTRKKWIKHENPQQYLKEHIMHGDEGDGIPNILTQDDYFVTRKKGDRQRRLTSKKINEITSSEITETSIARNYDRNRHLIDLSFIPNKIKEQVIAQYDSQNNRSRNKMLNYFIDKKLRNLMENLSDF
jgi:hypothetical protein